jgi:hypothetical protein
LSQFPAFKGLIVKDFYWRWPERNLDRNAIDFFVHVLGLLPRCHVPNRRDLNRNKSQNNRKRRGTRTPVRRLEPKKNQNSVSTGAETPTSWKITNEPVRSQPYDVSAAIGPQNPMPARLFGKNPTKPKQPKLRCQKIRNT